MSLQTTIQARPHWLRDLAVRMDGWDRASPMRYSGSAARAPPIHPPYHRHRKNEQPAAAVVRIGSQ
eukprot:CAMPEP_0174983698 /NCGR_PEP_ID=MMETSP0004_2-20121128/17297_1 /TAXON_ID=420556 /ORGANISM="Ochromonas sp., Strain CCMP1393" /LENGTH=65 /DNA_ID=CAMNT_0016235997 /DNA_START=1147 /DNA_END=1344 /DNA_ORIENTATION=-